MQTIFDYYICNTNLILTIIYNTMQIILIVIYAIQITEKDKWSFYFLIYHAIFFLINVKSYIITSLHVPRRLRERALRWGQNVPVGPAPHSPLSAPAQTAARVRHDAAFFTASRGGGRKQRCQCSGSRRKETELTVTETDVTSARSTST